MYIRDELSYDRYHEKADQIYRMVRERNINGEAVPSVGQPFRLGETLAEDIPEIKAQVRFFRLHQEAPVISRGEDQFYEERFYFTDANVFEFFSFKLLRGDPGTVLKEPFSVVLTESMARKYFGEQDPVGKTLTLLDQFELTVTGISEDTPANSHFHFDFLASHKNLDDIFFAGPRFKTTWIYNPCYTYILLAENAAISDILPQTEPFVNRHIDDELKRLYLNIYFQKLTDIHLHSHYQGEIEANSDIIYIYIFSAIGFLILLIACINFVNLSTARSIRRAKEVGLRKVLGARRDQLIKQFLGESILLSFLALLLAVAIIELFLPTYNMLTGKQLQAGFLADGWVLLTLVGIALFTGLISGLFPAFYLSAFKPVKVLKVGFAVGASGRASLLRRLLVVAQFTISIAMIIGTITVYQQLDYLRNKKLGFDREQILAVPINNTEIQEHIPAFKSELLRQANIINVAATSHVIGKDIDNHGYRPEGVAEEDYSMMPGLYADNDLVATLGAAIVAGRDFSPDIATDTSEAFIINETAVKKFGWS
ncbi:MAG: FtsX-like permease family protein, partial [candidate division Zixibacteria bacterium]|nr:FtsX-like permease family protein [candidate division Zixibacteria bacterium]NIX54610.1 FtsX-like permease family protein [candidate division Zixibacteria bacterium]